MLTFVNRIKSRFKHYNFRSEDTCDDKCLKHKIRNCRNCEVVSDMLITPEEALLVLRARYLEAHNME